MTKSIYTVNKARDTSGIYLYTNDFNAKGTTGCTEAGVDVVLVPADGSANADLRIGQNHDHDGGKRDGQNRSHGCACRQNCFVGQ